MIGVTPFVQRHILYAHKLYQWWQNSDLPQNWGFARNQVTSFHLPTEDGESIHAWHVLPLPAYRQHQEVLEIQPTGHCDDVTTSESLRILKNDPSAKLIVYLHGNAGHLPSVVRAPSFHMYTATSNYHVLAIDYRGFGTSTGSPTEDGLILDAYAALHFALDTAGLSPDRIIILGHSLGSAVAAGAAERYARVHGIDFAGLIMVASFSNLSDMLSGYAIAGLVPILKPLRSYPRVLRLILGCLVDHWESAKRLRNMVSIVHRSNTEDDRDKKGKKGKNGPSDNLRRHLQISLIHAADDNDIPCIEDDRMFATAILPLIPTENGEEVTPAELITLKEKRTKHLGKGAFVSEWREGDVCIRQERFPHGGHNNIVLHPPVLLEMMRIFEEAARRRK
ncbi:abhydrolase domain-containing protein 12 [Sporothrix brasiliensis 5110]|uniref:Abhydrolase domain-containing protein 12 n=1 Tax=Sporothrix brasiliensis 5110 TaxID=1398154 RepID=A0A0C2IEL6_9PEZI|nr:abhydrolase domain-containing protein 12 [Sporothrix brasiliensis 5110]KIH87681.1 abhydrolase domain-containing protein 12 [Sporothrix brasiliensis 5110]